MGLAIGERDVSLARCETCGLDYMFVKGFVHRDGDAYAVYFAACHGHPEHSAALDVILGTWHDDDADDRVTFSALVRLDGAEVIDATAVASAQSDIFGLQLSREDALVHEPVAEFCDLLDHVLAENRDVGAAVYGSAV